MPATYSREEFERDRFGQTGDELARHPLTNCWFCAKPGEVFCTTPVTEPVICSGAEVQRGDLIQRNFDLKFYRVLAIAEEVYQSSPMRIWASDWPRRIFTLEGSRGITHEQEHTLYLPLLRMETRACGLPTCERHSRELAPGRHMCVKHWDVEKVYGTD